jgi:hypothetical protein
MKITEEEEDSMNQEIHTMVEVMGEVDEEAKINNTLEDCKSKEVNLCFKSNEKDVFTLAMWWKNLENEMKIYLRINKFSNKILILMLQL